MMTQIDVQRQDTCRHKWSAGGTQRRRHDGGEVGAARGWIALAVSLQRGRQTAGAAETQQGRTLCGRRQGDRLPPSGVSVAVQTFSRSVSESRPCRQVSSSRHRSLRSQPAALLARQVAIDIELRCCCPMAASDHTPASRPCRRCRRLCSLCWLLPPPLV